MPEAPGHRRYRSSRPLVIAAVVAVLVAGGLADRATKQTSQAQPAGVVQPVPVAAPASALSSSWFCAGATDAPGGAAPAELLLVNTAAAVAPAVVTLVPSNASQLTRAVTVPARGQAELAENVPGGSPWIGAIVDVDAGGVAVFQQVSSPLGLSISPCATSGSASWYFANGETLINADVVLSLLNPYPNLAVVDLDFTTNYGYEAPVDFQSLVVPAGGLLEVDLRSHLRRRLYVATTVEATSGRVVAWKTDIATPPAQGAAILGTPSARAPLADPSTPIPGVTVTLGTPSPATRWVWPGGLSGGALGEGYLLYNPGQKTADLTLQLTLDEGALEPLQLTLGPEELTALSSSSSLRIPAGVGHAAVLESTNGVPVVAERVVAATGSPVPGSPPWLGLGELIGGRVSAERWVLPPVPPGYRSQAVVLNPGRRAARVSVYSLSGAPVAPVVLLAPGSRAVIGTGSEAGSALLVSSSEAVFVESDVLGSPGVGLSFGVPLR
jgi:hypothetical protein